MIYLNRFINALLLPFTWIFGILRRVIPGLKRLPALPADWLAFALSLVFCLTLVIIVLLTWYLGDDTSAQLGNYDVPMILALALLIPILMFWFVRLLLAPPKSPYPEIDAAWNAGLSELQKCGISIKNSPIYLILGMVDSAACRQLMSATHRSFDCNHVTADGQALYFYGGNDAIYIVLANVGNVGLSVRSLSGYQPSTGSGQEYQNDDAHKSTIDVGLLGSGGPSPVPSAPPEEKYAAPQSIKRTLKPGETQDPRGGAPAKTRDDSLPGETRSSKPPVTAREKVREQTDRMQHFCRLLKRVRTPVSSLNGILVNAPKWLVETFPEELSRQVRNDLETICQTTGVISTVTFSVSGFESEPGCREFVTRLSEKHGNEFYQRRFGKSYRSWLNPTSEQLESISHETVESFDQFTYSLFTQRDALSGKNVFGNRELVKFLCRTYEKFYPGLKTVLSEGFGAGGKQIEDFPRFAGCYFFGAGDEPSKQFFVNGVFERLDENVGELEWNSKVRNREEAWSFFSNLVFLLGLAAIAGFLFLTFKDSFIQP